MMINPERLCWLQIFFLKVLFFNDVENLSVANCDPIISEINIDSPSSIGRKNQFIELRFTCPVGKKPDLKGYKMIILKPLGSEQFTQAECNFYLTLSQAHEPASWNSNGGSEFYLLIGGEEQILTPTGGSVKVDIPFKSESIRSSVKLTHQGQTSIFDHMKVKGKNIPQAVVLFHVTGDQANKFNSEFQKMPKTRPYVPFSEEVKKMFLENRNIIIDTVVYGVKSPFTKCNIFELFSLDYQKMPKYVLNEWDGVRSDLSINYCGEHLFQRFSPHLFKYGKITPGKENDCSNPTYIIDIDMLTMKWFDQRQNSISSPLPSGNEVENCEIDILTNENAETENECVDYASEIQAEYSCSAPYTENVAQQQKINSDLMSSDLEECSDNQSSMNCPSPCPDDDPNVATCSQNPILDTGPNIYSEISVKNALHSDRKRRINADPISTETTSETEVIQPASKKSKVKWWFDKSKFNERWIEQIRTTRYLNKFIDPNWFTVTWEQERKTVDYNLRSWLSFEFNPENPGNGKVWCRICKEVIDKRIIVVPQNEKSDLASSVRFNDLSESTISDKNAFLKYLRRHIYVSESKGSNRKRSSTTHNNIIQELERRGVSMAEAEEQVEIRTNTREKQFEATNNMIKLVYAEIKLNIPFSNHEDIVKLLANSYKTNIGRLHRTRQSAVKIANFISNVLHEKLINHLSSVESHPLTLIIDGTTDKKGRHYLIVYFRALEKNEPQLDENTPTLLRPNTYFYKLIELTSGETADAQFEALKKEFDFDNVINGAFVQKLKENLVGFGSDGAAVNMGQYNGVAKKLRDWTNSHDIIAVHCMAHRLQLAIGYAWGKQTEFKHLETTVNGLYSFLMVNRKRNVLKNTAYALEKEFFELNYIHKIRWAASEYNAMKKIFKMYGIIIIALEDISTDEEFDSDDKAKAVGFLNIMKQRNFLSYLSFITDILEDLSYISREFQTKTSLVVGQMKRMQDLKELIRSKKTTDHTGTFTTALLIESTCSENNEDYDQCENMNSFETSKFVKYKDVVFSNPRERIRGFTYPPCSNMKINYVDLLFNSLTEYYPLRVIGSFDAFDLKNFPTTKSETSRYKQIEIGQLANYFSLDLTVIMNEWRNLLEILVEKDEKLNNERKHSPKIYWAIVAGAEWINWNNKAGILRLIKTAMVLPVSSSDAERGFSILKHAKYDRRSKLGPENLNAILRLRINGPDLDNFNAFAYAK